MSHPSFTSIQQALSQPWSRLFRLSYDGHDYRAGDEDSFYRNCLADPHLTYDISNNKVLVNVAANGAAGTGGHVPWLLPGRLRAGYLGVQGFLDLWPILFRPQARRRLPRSRR